jgi:hypothetical protein
VAVRPTRVTRAAAGQIVAKLNNPQYADRLVYRSFASGDPRDYVPMDVFADYMVAAHAAVHNAEAAAQNLTTPARQTMTPGQNNPES